MKKLNFLKPDIENITTYLSISLAISLLMNWYNKKMAIKEK